MALKTEHDPQQVSQQCPLSGDASLLKGAPPDAALFAELMNETAQAVALLDLQTDSIQWCSVAWSDDLPLLSAGVRFAEIRENDEVLTRLFQLYEEQGSSKGSLWCEGARQMKELRISQLSTGVVALQLHDQQGTNDDMHLYMQARESMFTTSRTISVSEMATTLAHEIKQPIATITNILKGLRIRLKKGNADPVQLEEALASALEQAQFTNSVINRIRDFTQARRPQQQIIEVANLTQEALSLMDWFLSANQCRTEVLISDELLHCQGDPTMLQQVLVNLLRNGVEAMDECDPHERVLIIECKRHANAVRISIRDYGHGLKGKEQTLFVPFSTSKANGMGVGLNICRSFVELHQGRLWLSPNSEGGCTSTMELPLLTNEQSEQQGRVDLERSK